jgi:hypothetical protein
MPDDEPDLDLPRDRELASRKDGRLWKDLIKEFDRIRRGFEDQGTRADAILDNWDMYNCKTNQNQNYQGNCEYYVPIVFNAVNARKTRFVNQIFPSSGRYIDAASDDGSLPGAALALIEHYVRQTKLRTDIMMALLPNGDLEGQYNLYVDWNELKRYVVSRETRPAQVQVPELGEAEGEDVETIIEEEIVDQRPAVEVLHDPDVLILPPTADSVEDALAQGGSVTIARRWTLESFKAKIADGTLVKKYADLIAEHDGWRDDDPRSVAREQVDAAGIKGKGKYILVYETWKNLKVSEEEGYRLCRSYYGGYDLVLSCRRNPFWNDRCPLISKPVLKIAGQMKGMAPVERIKAIQYHANDIANQAADSATYSMLPIVMTDPEKNPRTATMVLNLAAVWECDPNSTRFAEFPKLWQDGIAIIQNDVSLAFQTMGVNPAMLPQQTGRPGAKRNQAEIALEQTVDIMSTSEACSVLEEGVLTPLIMRFGEYDSQFRDDEVMIRAYGELGIEAKMERIKPRQFSHRYTFTWFGVEQARNAAQMQQQIALLNVAMTPQMQMALQKAGFTINPAPVLESAFGNVFGWRLARQVLRDARQQLSVDPMIENGMLLDGFDVQVHPLDEDPQHLSAHQQAMAAGDPTGMVRIHMQRHLQSMQMKAAAMMQRGMMQAMQGGQEGGGGGPGQPQPGATPAGPRLIKGPAGMIHPDQMARAGAPGMPRKM